MNSSTIKDSELSLLLKRRSSDGSTSFGKVIHGNHVDVVSGFPVNLKSLCTLCFQSEDPTKEVRQALVAFLKDESRVESLHERVWSLLVFGVALLELYSQANFTGPELSRKQLEQLHGTDDIEVHRRVLQHLECDGLYPFTSVDIPHILLLARIVLALVASPLRTSWKDGINLTKEGLIFLPTIDNKTDNYLFLVQMSEICESLYSAQWWQARALILHSRLLQGQSYEQSPTLWMEANEAFCTAITTVCSVDGVDLPVELFATVDLSSCHISPREWSLEDVSCTTREGIVLSSSVLLEWGLACHHFNYGDKGKKAFQKAKEVAKLHTTLTAALGKRTKYQREDIAQLFLFAASATIDENESLPTTSPAVTKTSHGSATVSAQSAVEGEESKQELLEIGRRVVTAADDGEEAAMREVMLDQVDTGVENIIMEGGPRFKDASEVRNGGQLSTLDQAILLALCLDVSNSNPADQLTYEEQMAYIERILQQANNWMVHSTALLERSWIEFERRKTADRAMLQIQALIDQHSTKLTYTQSSYKDIENSAPAQDRLLHLYQLVYPSVCEIRRDLAQKYLRCGVFMSALNYFKELELWDEVVTCYQLLSKPTRAELVVRERLKTAGESPYMLTSLADLTGQEDYYERAWVVSKKRFARAKRTLAKICFDRGQFAQCNEHLQEALAVQPLVHTAWYLKGLACMRLESWEEGVEAFVRCVQQDSEVGEAWANIGAIHMRTKSWSKALHALAEAAKHKHEDWRILENLLTVSLALQQWKDSVRYMSMLVDLRFKQQQQQQNAQRTADVSPVHLRELSHVVKVAAVTARVEKEPDYDVNRILAVSTASAGVDENTPLTARCETKEAVTTLSDLAQQVEKLLQKITSSLKSEAAVWDCVAIFYEILGRYRSVLDVRMKQFRAVMSVLNWMKDVGPIEDVLAAARCLHQSLLFQEVTSSDIYQVKMLLQSTCRKMEIFEGMEPRFVAALQEVIQRVESIRPIA